MTIKRVRGDVVLECDSCDKSFTIHSDNFEDTYNAAKREGWLAEKVGKDWLHGCPNCGVGK